MSDATTAGFLESLKIASPCEVPWESMQGGDHVRFCGQCAKNVYDVSRMPRAEAEALVRRSEGGRLCLRLARRADGTVLTDDCPVGLRRLRARAVWVAGKVAATLLIAGTTFLGCGSRSGNVVPPGSKLRQVPAVGRLIQWLDPVYPVVAGKIAMPPQPMPMLLGEVAVPAPAPAPAPPTSAPRARPGCP